VRTEQLLEAVERSILEVGVQGTTVANVARIANMRPSHVRHYLGDREDMIDAAARRAVARVEAMMASAVAVADPTDRLDALLDAAFNSQLAMPEVNQLIDELIAASYLDPAIRTLVTGMYRGFAAIIDDTLAGAFPHATKPQRRPVTHALLALAHSSATFEWLDIDTQHYRHARQAATLIIGQLADLGPRRRATAAADRPNRTAAAASTRSRCVPAE
jgi:AcrR family transcriptional regulator